VVTGTQEATERVKVPFSVAHIDASQLPVPAADPLTELQGKIPGNIVSNSGRPGNQPSVLLRGPTSLNAAGAPGPALHRGWRHHQRRAPRLESERHREHRSVKGAAGASLYGARAATGHQHYDEVRAPCERGVAFSVRSEEASRTSNDDFGIARYHRC